MEDYVDPEELEAREDEERQKEFDRRAAASPKYVQPLRGRFEQARIDCDAVLYCAHNTDDPKIKIKFLIEAVGYALKAAETAWLKVEALEEQKEGDR